jgi:Kef-type K+ transport system membrane component KefB
VAKLGTAGFGFFIPIFFINTGWNINAGWNVNVGAFLDPATLRTLGLLSVATLATRLLGLPALLLRLNVAVAVRAAALLATPLTLQIAIAEYGIQQHLLPTSIRPAVVATASLAAILYPILARRALFRQTPAAISAALPRSADRGR